MLTLTKDMETGVAKNDEQHRELINRINAVTSMGVKSASKEETQKTLDLLNAYIIKHFSEEEELQKQSKYPKFDFHKNQHQFFMKEFKALENEFKKNGPSPKFTLDLSHSIINWIVKHIKNVDLEFAKYYNKLT